MALDFPGSPTNGQVYPAPNGVTYVYDSDSGLWRTQGGNGENTVFISATAPVSPTNGKLWWNSVTGTMFVWYEDGDSAQWVPATTQAPAIIAPDQDLQVSTIEASGGVQTASINQGQTGGRRSLIINGGMEVAQRGDGPTLGGGYRTVDRMSAMNGGSADTDSQQERGDLQTTDAPLTDGHRNFFRITNKLTTIGTNTYRNFRYSVEGSDIGRCGWDPTDPNGKMTISFWARSSVTFTAKLWFNIPQEGGVTFASTSRNYSVDVPLVSDTWTKVEHTFVGNANNSLITLGNLSGFSLNVGLYWGTAYTDATDSKPDETWFDYSNDMRLNTMGTEWVSQLDSTFDITGLQLELGDVATKYEHRRYSEQVRDCQRYYFKDAGTGIRLHPVEHSNSSRYLRIPRPVVMRGGCTETGTGTAGSLTFYGDAFTLRLNASGVSSGSGVVVTDYTADAEI